MTKINSIKALGYGLTGLCLVLACDPPDGGGIGIPPDTGDDATTDMGTTTDDATTDMSTTSDSGSGGGDMGCTSNAPPQTYLCAGSAYEHEAAGAAALQLSTERASYACNADDYWYYYYPYYPYYDYDNDYYEDYYDGSGGTSTGDGDGDGDGDYGMGGVAYGGQTATGGSGAGGGSPYPGDKLSDWCDDLDPNDMVTGASFAVGECQLTDLALPLKITEPQYGNYEVTVYGGESPCDRGVVLAKTAGFGTGLPINIPVDPSGYSYVSVEMTSDNNWEGLELRLVDRPAVGDAPSE